MSLIVNKPCKPILLIYHQQLVDARMVGEELVGPRNGVAAQLLLAEGMDLVTRRERLGHLAFGIAMLDHVPGQQPHQLALRVDHREGAEGKALLLNQGQHIADQLIGQGFDRFLDQPVHVVFDPADGRELLAFPHVVVD